MIMWFLKKVRIYGLIIWSFLKLLKIKKGHTNLLTFIRCQNNKQNTEWVGYATPNKAARNLLPNNIKTIPVLSTQKEQKHLEVYKDLGEKTLGEYNESFLNFKMSLK